MMKNCLIVSQIQTPDGTILRSNHVHDYVSHTDANGLVYTLDGGIEYQRYTVNKDAPFKDISLYSNDNIEDIRKVYCRGGRGKDGMQPLKWVPLCEMSNLWIENCIKYNNERGLKSSISNYLYKKELKYRQQMGIFIEDI